VQPFDPSSALEISQAAIGRRTSDDLTFTAVDGSARHWGDYRGKPLVVSLVFTSCAHICPATTQQLRRGVELARSALGSDSFRVVTIGFDVKRDSPAMMAQFARRQRAELPNWDFLAADQATIDRLSAELGFLYRPAGGGFDHLIQSTIIDEQGVIRRQVYGIDFKLPHFVEPLKALVFGVEPEQSLYEELANRVRIFCTVYDPASDSYRFSYSIFVGLAMGMILGAAAIWALIREWRRYGEARRREEGL
jgi:protein SCO1/2